MIGHIGLSLVHSMRGIVRGSILCIYHNQYSIGYVDSINNMFSYDERSIKDQRLIKEPLYARHLLVLL